jgi:CheY-like chemotaxis protein
MTEPSARTGAAPAGRPIRRPEEVKILVVDDEPDVATYLASVLEDAGMNVRVAHDGEQGLQLIREDPPDLISLDLVMPKRSGIKFYRDLQKNKEWSDIPVIIVTGHARDDLGRSDLKELTMSGPGIYLEKPIKPDNYIAAIKGLLGLDTSEEETRLADKVKLQSELKNIVDDLDLETLQKLRGMMKNQ